MSERFQAAYLQGTTPWDIGAPQSVFITLFEAGRITGRALDAGCGTGENALYLASRGLDVVGVDVAAAAIEHARAKAAARGLSAEFEVGDVLDLGRFAEGFDTAIDSGCFHTFNDEDRARYVRSLHGVLRSAGHAFVMCFSDRQPGTWGPRRVTQAELRAAFTEGWRIDDIQAATFDLNPAVVTRVHAADRGPDSGEIAAWLTSLTRL
ncbi:MAG TPA: methyltransferase domain-containing protein [Candidatus Dormibacteraeota bacterium]